MTDFDEHTNPEARLPLHEEAAITTSARIASACRHYQRPDEVIAAADALVALAKGGAP